MRDDLRGWHLLPNGGAIYGDAETGDFAVYGADGLHVCTWTRPTDADQEAARRWLRENPSLMGLTP